eukprot:TRINITY_DN3022_c0_g1_i2.p1 TRINITY_DN3022_c0_g1~~TRINITY_DN3022_c0_g1_i2.p1  ORF type:complete len:443 (-),score=70.03 TRINITY_DN3022_c0_g1_i2:304-1572(-)
MMNDNALKSLVQQALEQEINTKSVSRKEKKRRQQTEVEFEGEEEDGLAIDFADQQRDARNNDNEFGEEGKLAQMYKQQKKRQRQTELEEGKQDQSGYEEEGNYYEDEGGVRVEPFNLREERARGYFDAVGNYIQYNQNDDEKEDAVQDAWLDSVEVMTYQQVEKIKESKIREQEKHSSYQQLREVMNNRQLFEGIANILQEGETVPDALRRLKKEKNQVQLLKLVELADDLMMQGETDVYSYTLRQFQAEAKVAMDEDGDMFEDMDGGEGTQAASDSQKPGGNGEQLSNITASDNNNSITDNSSSINYPHVQVLIEWFRQQQQVDYHSWPIKELVRVLNEQGVKTTDILDKDQLVQMVQDTIRKNNMDAPPGFVYDPSSQYFWNAQAEMFYEPVSAYFFSGQSRNWYVFDMDKGEFNKIDNN